MRPLIAAALLGVCAMRPTPAQARAAAEPPRVMSLCSSATAIALALGAADRLAAVDEHGARLPGAERVPVVARGGTVSDEAVLALGVQVAFVWWYQEQTAQRLERLGLPVTRMPPSRTATLPAEIRRVGAVLHTEEAAERLAAKLAAFGCPPPPPPATAPRVYLELYGRGRTAGADTWINDLIGWAGGVNIAAGRPGYATWSAEAIAAADPQVILFVAGHGDAAEIAQRPGWSATAAARDRRIRALPPQWLVAGPDFPQSVLALHAWLYPIPTPEVVPHAVSQDHL